MESNEITPHAVTSIEDLFAKLDMIHEAAQQLLDNKESDPELGLVLLHRAVELYKDLHVIDETPEHWRTVGEKLEAIKSLTRQANINDLNASFNLS